MGLSGVEVGVGGMEFNEGVGLSAELDCYHYANKQY